MPDIAITSVSLTSSINSVTIQLGESVPAYDLVYLLTGKYFLADATDVAKATATHIILTSGSPNDFVLAFPLSVFQLDLVGPTLVQAAEYVVSANAGKIADRADLASTNFVTKIGDGVSANTIQFTKNVTGIQVP